MPCFRVAIVGLLVSACGVSLAAARQDASPLRVLFLGDQGHHVPRQRFEQFAPLMASRGIDMTYTESLADLRLEHLRTFDALMVYANIDAIDDAAEQGLLDYVRTGGGFVPIHCASYCFRNSPQIVAMIGAQFQQHGTGVFRAEVAAPDHPLMRGHGGFESWDETYVHHLHNEEGRTVLSYRVDEKGREPWTWIRTEGRGRVFYTAWGHDERTWGHPGFANLLERGLRWAAGQDPALAGDYLDDAPFPVPEMTPLAADRAELEYVDVGKKIPNYTPSPRWGDQGEPLSLMQKPLAAAASQRHMVTPVGFRVELFASEPDLGGKPIFMTWDERGRLWVCETVDYPNEQHPPGRGRDRIRICEDTDGDGRADRFQVFAEQLSIPSTMAFYRGGVIVHDGTQTLYLKDRDGDDVADEREVWYTGWNQGDTHGGVSNFQYGLDNWIWAMQGYNDSHPRAGDRSFSNFSQGFFRFHPATRDIEFLRSTNNNTWGLGITEEGLVFGSTANRNPSVFMPIPNRYYEQVAGWKTSLMLGTIADTHFFRAITDKIRQVDQHGGYTAAAGHAIYTARTYPREYWNRTAFVAEPTGHLVGTFVLRSDGAGFRSTNPFNLLASQDEWTAPTLAEVGPDGHVWVVDWYNYIVQHNPTPRGFETGKGAAYESDLRDKTHGRIYRIVWENAPPAPAFSLAGADAETLVRTLSHPTMLWRKHAQRLLVEQQRREVIPALIERLRQPQIDEIGLDVGAIHALWTLHGLGAVRGEDSAALAAAYAALDHPSAGVRRNALQVLPPEARSTAALLQRNLLSDPHAQVRLQAFLTLADMPPSGEAGQAIAAALADPRLSADRWLLDAATAAAARHASSFLAAAAERKLGGPLGERIAVVAEHAARRHSSEPLRVPELIAGLAQAEPDFAAAVLRGWAAGWPPGASGSVGSGAEFDAALIALFEHLPISQRATLLQLADRWQATCLQGYSQPIVDALMKEIDDVERSDDDRLAATRRLAQFKPFDAATAALILDRISPQTPPALAAGWIAALADLQCEQLGATLVAAAEAWTPALRHQAFDVLLRRPEWTGSLLAAIDEGRLQVSDLTLEQRRSLADHPDRALRERASRALERGGALPSPDRQAVLEQYRPAVEQNGDATRGKKVFADICAKCHRHSGEGTEIGPDLTGMAVHPKDELLAHILDPNRSVESNFRMYQVLTADGLTLSGMLGSESKTAIELIDTQGARKSVLREDIDEMRLSKLSVMPEGFEKELSVAQMGDLLAFLAHRGTYMPLDLSKVASAASDRGMFIDRDADVERLIFPDWQPKEFKGVPFSLIDPLGGRRANVVVLFGPRSELTASMPKSVELPVNSPARAIHFLSGVSGWGFPFSREKSVSMIVRLHYEDGTREDHPLSNAEHFADYIHRADVPASEFAFALRGQQIRYIVLHPSRSDPLRKLQLIKGPDESAPVVMAITVETR